MSALRLLTPALLLAVAAPAAADWLVTTAGERFETRGAWEVRGAQVVFRTVEGRLSSLRASEIDLEASRALTATPPSVAEEPAQPAEPRPVALVLTDADVGHVRSSPEPVAEAGGADGEPPAEAGEPAPARVELLDWQERVDVDRNALLVTGQVANRGDSLVTNTRLEVRLLGSGGGVSESTIATLARSVLRPGERSDFTAVFPGSPGFDSIDFDLRSRGFRVKSTADSN